MRLPGKCEFNNHLLIDVFYAKDLRNRFFSFLNIICDATGFQVVCCLGEAQGPPASSAVVRHFLTSWSSKGRIAKQPPGRPTFSDYMKTFGVEQEAMPLEAPWKMGKVEKGGGVWKEVFRP